MLAKTTLTNAIMRSAELRNVGPTPFAAFTGMAASLGNGNTLHTSFPFPAGEEDSPLTTTMQEKMSAEKGELKS